MRLLIFHLCELDKKPSAFSNFGEYGGVTNPVHAFMTIFFSLMEVITMVYSSKLKFLNSL